MKPFSFRSGNRQSGFSLVDVMVGMVLALIGTIIIFQAFEVSEKIKRVTTGGGDAQQNGAQALLALSRAVKLAGYGVNASDVLATPAPVPLAITTNAATVPDSITITYRPTNGGDCPTTTPNCSWEYGPFAPPDALTFALPPPLTTLNYCVILDNNGRSHLVSRTVACGAGVAGSDANDTVLVDNIAQFKALPVQDATGRLIALQMVVVARNSQPERPQPGQNACNIATAPLPWSGGAVDVSGAVGLPPGLPVGEDWMCYHYRVFSVTVPLRNVIWS
ncbi:MAG TPA: hypothetical protein VIU46_09190 [Gallionellaceae bacterium]